MKFFKFLRGRSSAPVARERLQILLKHERAIGNRSQLVETLRKDVIAAVAKHIAVNPENVGIKLERQANAVSLLIDIEIVTRHSPAAGRPAQTGAQGALLHGSPPMP
jgi:cell division topological specificity factor